MNFSSQDAAQTLLTLGLDRGCGLGLGSNRGVGLGIGIALGCSEAGAFVQDPDLDWVSDSELIVFLNTAQAFDNLPFNDTRDDYNW